MNYFNSELDGATALTATLNNFPDHLKEEVARGLQGTIVLIAAWGIHDWKTSFSFKEHTEGLDHLIDLIADSVYNA